MLSATFAIRLLELLMSAMAAFIAAIDLSTSVSRSFRPAVSLRRLSSVSVNATRLRGFSTSFRFSRVSAAMSPSWLTLPASASRLDSPSGITGCCWSARISVSGGPSGSGVIRLIFAMPVTKLRVTIGHRVGAHRSAPVGAHRRPARG